MLRDSSSSFGGSVLRSELWVTDCKDFTKTSISIRYRLIVLNQKNQSNLIEDIDASWDLTTQMNYIFYRYHNEDRVSRFRFCVQRERLWLLISW